MNTIIVEELEGDLAAQHSAQLLALAASSAEGPLTTEPAQLEFCPIHPDATM